MNEQLRERLLHTCTWCMNPIPEGEERFAYGVKANNSIDLTEKEGEFVTLDLALKKGKTVIAVVTTKNSKARKQGFDLIFLTCSQACAEELKEALDMEQDMLKA
jgi:hypothetical protein